MSEMLMDYPFVLKGKAKETQDTASEVVGDTNQQVAYLHGVIFSPRSNDFYLTLVLDGASVTTTALSSALKHNVTISSPSGCG